jgi:hypothetical protein
MNARNNGTLRRGIGLALIALMAFGAMASGAAAHTSEEHGEVTVHDSEDGPPAKDIECEFWVKGHGVTNETGEIRLFHQQADFSNIETLATFEGEPNGTGTYDFHEGPFTYEHGWGDHYVYAIWNQSDSDELHRTENYEIRYDACEEEAEPPACPEDLRAQAHGNEDVTLGWNASADADSYHIYRATEDGEMTHVAEVNATSYMDTETEAETTYTYEVTAANEAGEAEDCPTAEVTAIPFFGGPALVAMAAVGSVGAVAAVRTRRG